MATRRNNTEIILPKVSDKEKKEIPVWDAYISKVIIDGDIPSLVRDVLSVKINTLIGGLPQKFSGELKSSIEKIITELSVSIHDKHGINYSKLRVVRESYYLLITTYPGQSFNIW